MPGDDAFAIANASWMDANVPAAASRLGLTVTPHDVVRRRVAERTSKIDDAIAQALDAGVLKEFNSQYRARRLAAKKAGKRFMSYSEALRRLRATVADAAASGGTISKSFIAAVFDEARPRP